MRPRPPPPRILQVDSGFSSSLGFGVFAGFKQSDDAVLQIHRELHKGIPTLFHPGLFQQIRTPHLVGSGFLNAKKSEQERRLPEGFGTFAYLQDPRNGGNTRHHFGEILFMAFAALLCGLRSYEPMEKFCELKESWRRKWLKLPNADIV